MNQTKDHRSQGGRRGGPMACAVMIAITLGILHGLGADQVDLQNGDRYLGKVLSLDGNTVTLHSEVLGTLRLPRTKVAVITLGVGPTSGSVRVVTPSLGHAHTPAVATPGTSPEHAEPLQRLGASTNLIQQIQTQLLGAQGTEANQEFNAMVAGLLSGQLTVGDIQKKAQDAVDQLKKLKGEMGGEARVTLDGYLAILENFLGQSERPGGRISTNALPGPRPSPEAGRAEE